jgi:molecular chaperone DnaK
MEAAQNAGFRNVSIMDEPSATAAAYMGGTGGSVKYAAVYDFGGGTFDLAVVDCASTPYRILAHEGDLYLGGDDVDFKLAMWAADEVLRLHGWDLKSDPSTFARLIVECERVKIGMGEAKSRLIDLMQVDPAAPSSLSNIEVTCETLDELSEELVRRTFILCDQVLKKAGLKAEQMDAVFVAGGGTLLSSVRDGVEKFFQKRIDYPFNPMQIVAIGASLDLA